jgi:hypothetical protein
VAHAVGVDASCTWLTYNRDSLKGRRGVDMATEQASAILALARALRHAVGARQETMEEALYAYNHVGGDRLDYAATFLKAMQRADAVYEETSRKALQAYRERVEQQ